ncbi:MAG TPA: hypothetical protein DEA08_17560 [Planctomycetes bacterium]|nr:hypothetical protein [Planctomycetota bacterium]
MLAELRVASVETARALEAGLVDLRDALARIHERGEAEVVVSVDPSLSEGELSDRREGGALDARWEEARQDAQDRAPDPQQAARAAERSQRAAQAQAALARSRTPARPSGAPLDTAPLNTLA